MWSSINSIQTPESLSQAYNCFKSSEIVYITGGSYLLAECNPDIQSIIDLTGLMDTSIQSDDTHIRIGAGITLQNLSNRLQYILPNNLLSRCILESCPSMNIRNQRSLGGEIAQARSDSELLVYLNVVDAELTIFRDKKETISIREWNGDGIITGVSIPSLSAVRNAMRRLSVIPSAPASVITAGAIIEKSVSVSVGGDTTTISNFSNDKQEFNTEFINSIVESVKGIFHDNKNGSVEYKQHIVNVFLKRIRNEL